MPIDPAKLSAMLDEQDAQQGRASALNAPKVAPDAMARAIEHSRRRGVAPLAVATSLDEFDELDTLDRFSEAGKDARLSAWLTPERAALAKDDLGPLTKLSASLRKIVTDYAPAGSTLGILAQAGDPNLAPHLGTRFQVGTVGMVADTARTLGEAADRVLNPARGIVQRLQAEGIDARYSGIETPRAVADQAAGVGREVRADQQALSQVYARGTLGYHGGQIADSLPQFGAAAVLRDPRLAAGAMGLFSQSRGVAQGMDDGRSFFDANLEAAIPTAAETVGARLTFGQVFGQGSRLARMGTAGLTEGGGEAATEFSQATYEGRTKGFDPAEVLLRSLDAAIAGFGTGSATAAIAPQSREQVATAAKAVRSLESNAAIAALTEAGGESKTVQRAPAEVEALVGDAGHVYVPVEQARLLFQGEGFDGWAAEITGDPDASAADSGDLRIPTAKWVSTVSRFPNAADWVKQARNDPEGFSPADLEAADFLEREFGLDNEAAAEAAKPVDVESTARVEQDVMGQLIGTGRYRESDAEAQAKFMAKVFGTLASRSGTDAWALYQSYNPAIRDGTERMGKPNLLDPRMNALLDAVRSRRIPDGPEVTGQTLLPFLKAQGGVMDEGGELRARDVGKLRPGLVSMTGLPLDYAREAAVEMGYLPDGASVNDLLDAIDAELRGNLVTSEKMIDEKARRNREFRDEALALSAQIDEQFADMTAEEFDALTNQEIVDRLAGESPKGMLGRAADLVRSLYQRATGEAETLNQPADGTPRPPRGGIELFDPSNVTIHLFEKADRSTFLHEGSHLYLKVLSDLAARPGASEQVLNDFDAFLRWSGFTASPVAAESVDAIPRRLQLAANALGNLAVGKPLSAQGKNLLRAESLLSVLGQVASAVENRQVLDAVVGAIPVDVMDVFVAAELSPDRALHDVSVLQNLFLIDGDQNVAVSVDMAGALARLLRVVADATAERAAVSGGVRRADHLSGAAVRAGDLDGHDSSRPSEREDRIKRIARWHAATLEEQRFAHEAFAEGFEHYLLEGRAPTPEVASLFGRFRAWMVSIYGALRRHRIPLSDDVRQVFDRLVATDAEIEAAKPAPALTDEQLAAAGFTPDEIAAHRARLESAIEAAKAGLASKALKAYERERKAWWKEERAKLRDELEAEAGATPAVQAFKALRGKGGPKLSMDGLRDLLVVVPESFPKGLTSPNGDHPDAVAMVTGFSSGSELVQALMRVPDTIARLDEQAEALMRERHGDPMVDGTLPEKAMRAAHNAKQVRALEDELLMLEIMAADPTAVPQKQASEGSGPSRETRPMSPEQRARVRAQAAQRAQVSRAFKAIAERKVAAMKVRDLKPGEHLAAEKRAMRRSIEAAAANDFVAAAKAKREQILHASLYRASRDAQSRATRHAKFLGKQGTTKARARLGKAGDYLEQVDGLLERFDLRKISDKASERRQSLRAWVEAQQAAGVPVDVPETLLDDAYRTPFRELTVAEFDDLATTVKHLVHLAGLKNKLLLKGQLRDREEVDSAMAASVREALKARGALGLPSAGDTLFAGRMEFRAVQGAATDLARELDGFNDLGPVWRNTVGVIRDAVNNDLNPALQAEQDAVANLYLAHYSKAELRRMGQRRSLGELGTWTHERLLALALNWGNAGNREAVLTQARNRLTPEQAGRLLGELDARDWQFVQQVWAHIDRHWPALAEAHRRRTGLPLKKVEAAPFGVTTKDGQSLTVTGGYYPLKGEADTAKSVKDEAEDLWDALRLGRTAKAATKDGHRKERVGFGGRTVRLDLGVLDTHLRDVLRDIHLGDAVNYVHQTLNGDAFGSALSDTGTLESKRALEFWLKDVASGEIAGRTWYERSARYLRTSFTAAVLTYRVASAALQITGFAASASVLGPKLLVGIRRVQRYPRASFDYVDAASPMMKARAQGHQDAVLAVSNARSGHVVASRAAMMRWGFWMMGRVQRLVDVATWIAAEADARGRGLDEAAARLFADDVVTRAQGSQEFIDKAPLQRGTLGDSTRQSEWIRALSALSGYMLAKGNLLYEKTARTDFRKPGQVFTWSGHMVSLLVVEAMVAAAIRGKLPDDEDDDGYGDDLLVFAGKEAWFGLVGSIPGLNAISGNLRGYGSSGIVGGLFDAFAKLYDQFRPKDGEWQEFDQAAQKATVRAVGYATGAPASAINTTIDTLHAEANGEDVKPHHYLVGPPKESK